MNTTSISPSSSAQENGQNPENPTMTAQVQAVEETQPDTGVTGSQPSQGVLNSTYQNTSNQQRMNPGSTPSRVGGLSNLQGTTTTVNTPQHIVQPAVANTNAQTSTQTVPTTANIPQFAGMNQSVVANVQQYGAQMPYFNAYGYQNYSQNAQYGYAPTYQYQAQQFPQYQVAVNQPTHYSVCSWGKPDVGAFLKGCDNLIPFDDTNWGRFKFEFPLLCREFGLKGFLENTAPLGLGKSTHT